MSITHVAIALIAIGDSQWPTAVYWTRAAIDQYGMGDGSAFMIKLPEPSAPDRASCLLMCF